MHDFPLECDVVKVDCSVMVKNRVLNDVKNCKENVESYCIQKAKECMVRGDHNLAKSWFLTASNLFPNSYTIRVSV